MSVSKTAVLPIAFVLLSLYIHSSDALFLHNKRWFVIVGSSRWMFSLEAILMNDASFFPMFSFYFRKEFISFTPGAPLWTIV